MRLMVTVVIPKNQHISEQCQKIFTFNLYASYACNYMFMLPLHVV